MDEIKPATEGTPLTEVEYKNQENFKAAALTVQETSYKKERDTAEKLMNVYFDDSGNIKCISPVTDEDLALSFQHTKLPLKNVYRFITGEIAPNKFIVKKKKGKINEFVIVERVFEVNYVRKLDKFLTEIEVGYGNETALEIIADTKTSTLTFKLAAQIRIEYLNTIDDVALASIAGLRTLKFYCTTKNDPSYMIESYKVSVAQLLQGPVFVKFNSDLKKYSLFTRQVFEEYSYKIT